MTIIYPIKDINPEEFSNKNSESNEKQNLLLNSNKLDTKRPARSLEDLDKIEDDSEVSIKSRYRHVLNLKLYVSNFSRNLTRLRMMILILLCLILI